MQPLELTEEELRIDGGLWAEVERLRLLAADMEDDSAEKIETVAEMTRLTDTWKQWRLVRLRVANCSDDSPDVLGHYRHEHVEQLDELRRWIELRTRRQGNGLAGRLRDHGRPAILRRPRVIGRAPRGRRRRFTRAGPSRSTDDPHEHELVAARGRR